MKKHDGRWMDIQQSLLLESFADYKLTRPYVGVNIVGQQVNLEICGVYNPFAIIFTI